MSRETSCFGLRELKFKSSAARTFTGYGAVFDNVDAYGDAIQRGAFRRSLEAHRKAGTMPAMLAQHGGGFVGGDLMPIGKWLSIEEDDFGLAVEGR
jgi:HK97 family phage prohead protease